MSIKILNGSRSTFYDLDTAYSNGNIVGRISWDQDNATAQVGLNTNVVLHMGQDDMWYVKNQTGASIPKGSVVYAAGTVGASGRILVAPYIANGTIAGRFILGIAAEAIADGADGYVIAKGKLRNFNTNSFTAGTVLWASPTTAGAMTSTEPAAPNIKAEIAFVVHQHTNNGVLAVRRSSGTRLSDDSQVEITSPSTGQLLRYNSNRWENWSPNFLTAEADTLQTVTSRGSSTTTGATFGGNVGIGTTAPTTKLTVVDGGIEIRDGSSTGLLYKRSSTFDFSIENAGGNLNFFNYGADERLMILVRSSNRVSIGNNQLPSAKLEVQGQGNTSATSALNITNISNTSLFRVRDDAAAIFSGLAGTGTRMVVADANGLLSTQAVGSGTVTGTGTTNYISKFTSGSAIGDSQIFDNGTNVGIGTTAPALTLEINSSTTAALPATAGSTQSGGGRMRLTTTGAATAVIDFGTAGGSGGWIQATNKADLTTNYPLLLNPNGGNVGIGTSSPSVKLDVSGIVNASGGIVANGENFEKYLGAKSFADGVANRAINVQFGNFALGGRFEITITGTFSNANAGGGITKVFSVLTNPSNNIYTNESRVTTIVGPIASNFAIGEFQWDSGSSQYIIPISHIVSSGNPVYVHIKVFGMGSVANVYNNVSLSDPYTLTALSRNYEYYNGNVGIGTTSPSAKLVVNGGGFAVQGDSTPPSSGYGLEIWNSSTTSYIGSYNRTTSAYRDTFLFASNTIFENGGSERMRITSGGNVGIGTTAPGAPLEVNSNGGLPIIRARYNATYYTDFDSNGINFLGSGQTFDIKDNGSPVVRIASGGNVGIGTTAPNNKLSVVGNIEVQSSGSKIGFNVNDAFTAYGTSVAHYGISYGFGANFLALSGYFGLGFFTDGTERMRIAFNGNVLIGTTADNAYKLRVNGKGYFDNNVVITPTSESWAEGLAFSMPSTTTWGGLRWRRERVGDDGNWYIGFTALDSTDDLVFGANNGGSQVNNIIRLTKAGNVGIGTNSPANKLQIGSMGSSGYGGNDFTVGDGTSVFAIYMGANLTNLYTNKAFSFQNSGAGSTGNVLINTTTDAGFKLDVNGTGRFSGALTGTSAAFSGLIQTTDGYSGRYFRIFEASSQRGGLYTYNVISGAGTDYSVGLFSESTMWFAAGGGVTKNLQIAANGAATFSSSVTATSFIGPLTGNASTATSAGNSDTVDGYHETAFVRLSANSSSPTNDNFAIGSASGRNFIQSHSSQPLDINPLGNTVFIGGSQAVTNNGGTWGISITGNAATITSQANSATITAATAATANTIVLRDGSGDIYSRYSFSSYVNTTDNDEGGITRFVIKNGDNYHRSATTTVAANIIRGVASGTWEISITGNADTVDGFHAAQIYTSTANEAGSFLGGHYSSGGNEKPNSATFGAGKLKLAMLSGSNLGFGGSWNDVLWLSSYNGGDVKSSHALVFDKYSTNVWVSDQNFDSASWGTGYLLLHSGNFNSYAPALGGAGAFGTWEINITGTASSAPNAGNINPFYNVTAGVGNGLRFWGGSDDYKISMGVGSLYQYGPVIDYSIKTQMDAGSTGRGFTWGNNGVAPIASLNATSGNMQIAGTFTASNFSGSSSGTNTGDQTNISGNAATSNRVVKADEGNLNTAFTNTPAGQLSWAEAFNQTNAPTANTYYNTISMRHSNPGNVYGNQLSIQWLGPEPHMYLRVVNNDVFGTWRAVLTDFNYNSYALPISGGVNMTGSFGLNDNKLYLRTNGDNNHYIWNSDDDWEEIVAWQGTGLRIKSTTGATLATFSTSGNSMNITGDAATVGGYAVSVAGTANTIPTRNASGYLIPENWIQLNGIYGLYSPTNNAHLRPNSGTYGPWLITGARNGWSGIEFDGLSNGNVSMMIGTASQTVGWHNNNAGWQFLWENGVAMVSTNAYGGGTLHTVLHTGNFNSYAPTLTGGGASGTWGISITGNAATASSVAWTNVSGRPTALSAFTNDTGFISNSSDSFSSVARVTSMVTLTAAEYSSLSPKLADTLYIVI